MRSYEQSVATMTPASMRSRFAAELLRAFAMQFATPTRARVSHRPSNIAPPPAKRKTAFALFSSLRAHEESVTHNFLLKICATPPPPPQAPGPAFDSCGDISDFNTSLYRNLIMRDHKQQNLD